MRRRDRWLPIWLAWWALVALPGGCGVGPDGLTPTGRPGGLPAAPTDAAGEVLLSRLQCTACHAAPKAVEERLRPLAAPRLDGIGARVSPAWLDAYLTAPHELRPRTRMPDLLARLPEHDRAACRAELVHYLTSLGGPFEAEAGWEDAWDPEAGRVLFDQVGCRACHGDDLAGRDLPAMTDLSHLTAFLLDPLTTRPSGEMPDLRLSDDDARALASHLLRDQFEAGPLDAREGPGLRRELYLFDDDLDAIPALDGLKPDAVDIVRAVGCEGLEREDRFALRFTGELYLAGGESQLWITSDDGSRLSIDGEVVIDNDGLQSPTRKAGTVRADAGWHALTITFFENNGGQEVSAGVVEDGDDRAFGVEDLRTIQPRWGPPGPGLLVGPRLAQRGRRAFTELGCVACHGDPGGDVGRRSPVPPRPPRVPDLLDLAVVVTEGRLAGCLAEDPGAGVPDFHLDDAQRTALSRALAGAADLSRPLEPTAEVDLTLRRLGCLSCHARDDHPGPRGEARALFTSDEDLGDEGRLPPTLTGVGAKLRPDWLGRVLADGASVRPYMHTRMPTFGEENVGHLVQALALADGAPLDPGPPAFDVDLVAEGRALTGTGGLSCISCHTTHGHASLGIPGLDLGSMGERLRPAWFERWMREPLAVRPGTRMPTFFDEGRSVKRDSLHGDAAAQIDAMYRYLSLGVTMPLPPGLIVDGGAYAVVPVDAPRYVGAFMDGLSARVLAVGFPEKVAAAYDMQHGRLGLLWKGDFFDAEGTWRGRAGKLEVPPSEQVIELPPGPAVAVLDDAERDPWPEGDDGWRYHGRGRDQFPDGEGASFVMRRASTADKWSALRAGDLQLNESVWARFGAEGGVVVRAMSVMGTETRSLGWRAAVSTMIEERPAGVFTTAEGVRLTVTAGRAWIWSGDGSQELRIEVPVGELHAPRAELEIAW